MRSEPILNGHGGPTRSATALEQLLTISELAERLSLSERTIRRMVGGGQLPCLRLGRQLRFVPGDVLRWLAARKEV
jgi:excisionase family DNA binding protein